MVRQCAWCLRLMNSRGERTSALPVAKIYEATHGICRVCGILWLETVGESNGNAGAMVISQSEDGRGQCMGERTRAALPPLQDNEDFLLLSGDRC
jgi:hypothetical protein